MLVDVGDTRLNVVERGAPAGLPLLVLHGGPGLDHTEFGRHLDPLGDEVRLLLVDQREQGRSDRGTPPETWTLPQFARDVDALADALRLDRYAVLGHSFGAFVALHHALDSRRPPVATVLSSGVPADHWMAGAEDTVDAIADPALRDQVRRSFEAEATVDTPEGVVALLLDQLPFHFADPHDPRIAAAAADTADAVMSPAVLREADVSIDVEDRLGEIAHPVLVTSGRHDRLTTADAAASMAARIPGAELVVFERSAHMAFIEEADAYLEAVRGFLRRAARGAAGPAPSAGADGPR